MHDNILIGPHEERELELMLAGTKPLAMFYEVPGHDTGLNLIPEEKFQPYVDNGVLIKAEQFFDTEDPHFPLIRYVLYALPQETDRIQRLIEIKERLKENTIDKKEADRVTGQLLGYSEEEIEAFILHKY